MVGAPTTIQDPYTNVITVRDLPVRCVNLQTLIAIKRALGRPKDLLVLEKMNF
jgi:hypothetical protein